MNRSRLLGLACWAVLFAVPVQAQPADPPALPLDLHVDYATFQYDADHSLVETYLAFEAASLPYARSGAQYEVALPVAVTMRRTALAAPTQASDAAVFADTVTYRFAVADTAG